MKLVGEFQATHRRRNLLATATHHPILKQRIGRDNEIKAMQDCFGKSRWGSLRHNCLFLEDCTRRVPSFLPWTDPKLLDVLARSNAVVVHVRRGGPVVVAFYSAPSHMSGFFPVPLDAHAMTI